MFFKGFPQDQQITYTGMFWLLAAQLIVMAPLTFYLPLWLIPVLLFSAGWRICVMQGHIEQPKEIIKFIVGGVGIGALLGSGMELVSLDMMASLLMFGFSYKALEIIQRRDGMVVILTGFLLISVLFLYSQSMLTTIYALFALTALTGAMIAIQQCNNASIIQIFKLSTLMLVLCLPLMLLLFLFAPRFSPLWTIPIAKVSTKTGMTDRMTPGDIANLSQSDELAFTVKFLGKRPKQNELYWRGLVLQNFDGNTWTQFSDQFSSETVKTILKTSQQSIISRLTNKGNSLKYEVIYEKSAQPWLYSLSPVVNIKGDAFYGSDFRIISDRNILEPTLLTLVSYPKAQRELYLPKFWHQLALQLPEQGNSESRALAQRLLASSTSKVDYIEKILYRYKNQKFYYTLHPPLLNSSNSIDDFMLNTKKGFCAHFAGSFVFMMRTAGIPARVIAGYQGGEWNENGNFLAVHQYDAHAWAEVWLKGKGWIKIDPTAMVAPDRVEKNLESAVKREGSFLEQSTFSITKNKWLNSFRKKLDSTQYAWRRFVLGYDEDTQAQFLKRLLGERSVQNIALIVGSIFLAIILLWVMCLGLGRKHTSIAIEHQLYLRFCQLFEKHGVKREPSQTPEAFSLVVSACYPQISQEINSFTKIYSTLCYQIDQQAIHHQQTNKLKKRLKKISKLLRPQLV